jgi:hypothetical protein
MKHKTILVNADTEELIAEIEPIPDLATTITSMDGFWVDENHCEICAPQEMRLERYRCPDHVFD